MSKPWPGAPSYLVKLRMASHGWHVEPGLRDKLVQVLSPVMSLPGEPDVIWASLTSIEPHMSGELLEKTAALLGQFALRHDLQSGFDLWIKPNIAPPSGNAFDMPSEFFPVALGVRDLRFFALSCMASAEEALASHRHRL